MKAIEARIKLQTVCTGAAISVYFKFLYNCPFPYIAANRKFSSMYCPFLYIAANRKFPPRVLTVRDLCIGPRGAV